MIEEVEALLQHWAERCRRGLGAPSGVSPLAVAMQYGGMVPRATGCRAGGMAGGVDLAAEEVDAALAVLKREGDAEDVALARAWSAAGQGGRPPFGLATQLVRLARVRYLSDPMPTVEQQCRRLKIGSEATYRRRVQQLHERVRDELQRRQARRAA